MTEAHLDDELLSAHVDDALSSQESARVAAHLFTCPVCSARVDGLRATRRAVASLPVEAPPRALDLGFTRAPERARTPWRLRLVPQRMPAWAPPLTAAAVVAALAVGLAPALLRSVRSPAGDTTRTEAGLNAQSLAPGATGTPSLGGVEVPTSRLAPVPGGEATVVGSQPSGSFSYSLTDGSSRVYSQYGGANLRIDASPPSAPTGSAVQVTLTLAAGSSGLHVRSIQVVVQRGGSETVVAASQGDQVVAVGAKLETIAGWTAGAAGGSPGAGSVQLVGRVNLADGTVLEVTLPFTAT